MKWLALLLLLGLIAVSLFSQNSPHSVTLTWNAPTSGGSVTGYNVKRSATSGAEVTIAATSTTSYIDPFQTTDEGKKFFYVVTATGPGGESTPSNEVSATIPFSVPATPAGLSAFVR